MNFSLVKDKSTFILSNGPQQIATLKYNAESNSVRLHSKERRVFFVEEVGFLQTKIILKTEYGVEIGENHHIGNHHKGSMHLGNDKFSYKLDDKGIKLYNRQKDLVASFTLDKARDLGSYEASALMFSLAWLLAGAELSGAEAHTASALYAF